MTFLAQYPMGTLNCLGVGKEYYYVIKGLTKGSQTNSGEYFLLRKNK